MSNDLLRALKRILQDRLVLLNLVVYPLSSLFPRNKKIWLFGHRFDTFEGNSKYLYLWLCLNRPDITAVWLTDSQELVERLRSHGLVAHLRSSMAGVLFALRAKFHLFTHSPISFLFSGGSIYVNLWHGVGIKNIEFAANTAVALLDPVQKSWLIRLLAIHLLRKPDVLISTSKTMSAHFSKCFQLPLERCAEIGTPRLDALVDLKLREFAAHFADCTEVDRAFANYSEVYIYLPTWRGHNSEMMNRALPDLRRLSEVLSGRNGFLFIKPHPFNKFYGKMDYANIQLWPSKVDVYLYLDQFHCLITDYSSILYDYIAVKSAGVIIYAFDLAEYPATERSFAFPFEDNIIGRIAPDFESLCDLIGKGQGIEKLDPLRREVLLERFWGKSLPPASARIVEYLERTFC